MPTVTLIGSVLPDGFKLTIEHLPQIAWEAVDGTSRATYNVNISESVVTITVDKSTVAPEDISDMVLHGFELSRCAVDVFSFNTGSGLSVNLHTLVLPDGSQSVLVPRAYWMGDLDVSMNAHSIHRVVDGSIDWVYKFLASNTSISSALNALTTAISTPRLAEINCARSIETIKCDLCSYDHDEATWMNMRLTLNISESYLRSITSISRLPRHGKITWVEFHVLDEIINKAWRVMERFIALRQRSLSRLPLSEFPILDK